MPRDPAPPDVILAEGYISRGGLVFRVRASGDLAAVVTKAGGWVLEYPVRVLMDAGGRMIVQGLKDGLVHMTLEQFRARVAPQVE